MNHVHTLMLTLAAAFVAPAAQAADPKVPVKLPAYKDGAYVTRRPPSMT